MQMYCIQFNCIADVVPYEAVKLRMLNGTHSLLAYRGGLAGYGTIAEAVADPALADETERLRDPMRRRAG